MAFRTDRGRPTRASAADEPRGRILLFTGVRYERMGEPAPDTVLRCPAEPPKAEARRGLG